MSLYTVLGLHHRNANSRCICSPHIYIFTIHVYSADTQIYIDVMYFWILHFTIHILYILPHLYRLFVTFSISRCTSSVQLQYMFATCVLCFCDMFVILLLLKLPITITHQGRLATWRGLCRSFGYLARPEATEGWLQMCQWRAATEGAEIILGPPQGNRQGNIIPL